MQASAIIAWWLLESNLALTLFLKIFSRAKTAINMAEVF